MDREPGEDAVLQTEVRRVVEQFRGRYGSRIDDPSFVRERCAELSEEFAEACRENQIPARTISGARFGEDPQFPGIVLLLAGHYATVVPRRWDEAEEEWVGELVVDWTVHQFTDPTVQEAGSVPWVVTVDEWRNTWKRTSDFTADDW